MGISSIRTAEGYVVTKLQNVLCLLYLYLLQGKNWENEKDSEEISYSKSKKILHKHSNQLFNREKRINTTKIMETMPDEAGKDLEIIRNLIVEGMEIARINLRRGNIELWKKMVANIKQVKKETNQ